MNENLKKLILIEFGIVLISFLILSNLNAQGNPSLQPVTSAHNYCNVENSMDDLAVEPYHIHQISPGFSSVNYYHVNGKFVNSSWNRKEHLIENGILNSKIGKTSRND
ncbi:MAG TPA: hypothetical protein VFW11_14660 [Cyclobacteriaceae bacterium]|nr:hypothetical protein [Cyclobacteriaceae bacterium]